MKKQFLLFSIVFILINIGLKAQVQVDHPIQLTGSGSNAKIMGIQSVTNTQDATNVGSIQNGNFIYAAATGTSNNFILTLVPPISAYDTGMFFNFISNQNVNGPATLNINGLGAHAIKKNIDQDLGQCDIQNRQFVTVGFDGLNFQMISASVGMFPTTANAGANQMNAGYDGIGASVDTTTLSANTPSNGTGIWNISSGSGGNIVNPSTPNSIFTGTPGSTYTLTWTISTACGSSSSNDTILFASHGNMVFDSTGVPQTFIVPAGVTAIDVKLWGAGGGAGVLRSNPQNGGAGGYTSGTMSVTPGENLTIVTGGKGITTYNTSQNGPTPPGGYGGGGNGGYNDGGSGGGRSAIISGSNELITAGGGGGGGENCSNGNTANGGAGGGLTGVAGDSPYSTEGGGGGTQSIGGAAGVGGNGSGLSGSQFQGGNCPTTGGGAGWSGGGGGGYYGGGSSGVSNCAVGGGGGGSSFIGGAGVTNGMTLPGSGIVPPNTTDGDYVAGIGYGAQSKTNNAGNGLVVIIW